MIWYIKSKDKYIDTDYDISIEDMEEIEFENKIQDFQNSEIGIEIIRDLERRV